MNNLKNLNEDFLALISAIRSHLEFYQELGLTHIGRSSLLSDVSPNISPLIIDNSTNITLEDMAKKILSQQISFHYLSLRIKTKFLFLLLNNHPQ